MATNAEFLEYACQQWVTGGISNFEYIEILNSYASRSYHDLEQYPVFPWVVADYTSRELGVCVCARFFLLLCHHLLQHACVLMRSTGLWTPLYQI